MSEELPDIPDVGRYVFTDNFLENACWTPQDCYNSPPPFYSISFLYMLYIYVYDMVKVSKVT